MTSGRSSRWTSPQGPPPRSAGGGRNPRRIEEGTGAELLGRYLIDRRPLRIAAFRRLWTASAITAVGGSFGLVAVPLQVFARTGSSAAIGGSAAVSLAALVVAAVWSGARADASDRRRLLLAGNAVLGAAHLGLWLATALALDSFAVVLVLVAVQGLGFGTTMTVMGAAVPRVVPAAQLVAANSLSALTRYTGAVISPLLAGVLIPATGLATLYLLDALALGGVLWAVAALPAMPPTSSPSAPALRQLTEGVRYLAGRPLLIAICAVDLAAMVFAMPTALFPELAHRVYGGPAGGGAQLGLLFAAYPAGVFLAGLFSGPIGRARRLGALMAAAALSWSGCVMLLSLATDVRAAALALAAGGALNFVHSTCRTTIAQARTDDALRGRTQGVLTVVLVGGPQLANVLHGVAGAALGARIAIGVGGALTLAAVLLLLRAFPGLWRYDAGLG